jgi:two-component sensor histidine kinase/tetratricopeptide (TPR) repeat protein
MYFRFLLIISLFWALVASAQTLPQDSLRVARITNDSARIMETATLGVDLMYGGKPYTQAATYLERAESESVRLNSVWLQAQVTRKWGELEWAAEHFPEALNRFQQAEQAFIKLEAAGGPNAAQRRYFVLFMKLRQGQVLNNANYLPQAERLIQNTLRYARQLRNLTSKEQSLVASAYSERSIIAGKRGQQPQSLAYIDTAAQQAKAIGDEASYYTFLLNGAITRKNLGQFATALQQYKACAAYYARTNDTFGLVFAQANMPRALLGLKRYDEGIVAANEALLLSQQIGQRLAVQSDVHESLSMLYEAKGNYRQALASFRKAKAQHDSLFSQDKERQVQELTTKYEGAKKEAQIQELEAKARQRTWQLASLGGGAMLLALLLGVSVYQSRRLRRSNQRISKQAGQLQLLMRELHHRTKNNLAIVSGLLELQANRTDNNSTKEAFREGQQRIQAMSLIHQRLYQTDTLTTIDFSEYIRQLVYSLMDTYGYTTNTLELHLSLKMEAIEADTAIPLGLIINELLTNVFKYAYQHVAHPRLEVGLARQDDSLQLTIADNGPGLDLAAWNRPGGSFGKQLVRSLSHQLRADLHIETNQGTHIILNAPVTEPELVSSALPSAKTSRLFVLL